MPRDVEEHANIERSTAHGGYGRRQLYELVQNGADAILAATGSAGRIEVRLTEQTLYVANEGEPVDRGGIEAILASHVSRKRSSEIGRFGLGFKSVLEVSKTPQFFSRSVSFDFDADWAASTIAKVVPKAQAYPTLRLARTLDAAAAGQQDPHLDDLMSWATTVVRLPRNLGPAKWLNEDLASFPAEFLVFAPHVKVLVLEDVESGTKRVVRSEATSERITVHDEETSAEWRVFQSVHTPSAEAREDAGELADRGKIPIIWAVPTGGRAERGQFWAFFPTEYQTTLSGILNAPWKTNEDRQNLLNGRFNAELMLAAAQLIAESAPLLRSDEDPGKHLDLIPARGRESPNWADDLLTQEVYREASERAFLPDQKGALRQPAALRLIPSGVSAEAQDLWSSSRTSPVDWCHHTTATRPRHSRTERLVGADAVPSVVGWLESLIVKKTPAESIVALQVLKNLLQDQPGAVASQLRRARVLMTIDGEFLAPSPDAIFLKTGSADPDSLQYVHPKVAANKLALDALRSFSIGPADAAGALRGLLSNIKHPYADHDWDSVWGAIRALEPRAARAIAVDVLGDVPQRRLHGQSQGGHWKPLSGLYWPGDLWDLPLAELEDALVDDAAHRDDEKHMQAFGVQTGPGAAHGYLRESWFGRYKSAARDDYYESLRNSQRPNRDYLEVTVRPFAGPLEPLLSMGDEARAVGCHALLSAHPDLTTWEMMHRSQGQYPVAPVPNPVAWFVREHGKFRTSWGIVESEEAVAGPVLEPWSEFLPVVHCEPAAIEALGFRHDWDQLTEAQVERAFEISRKHPDLDLVADFYVAACQRVAAPRTIACFKGEQRSAAPPKFVTVAVRGPGAEALLAAGEVVLSVATSVAATELVSRWGLRSSEGAVTHEISFVPLSPEAPLSEVLPALGMVLTLTQGEVPLVRCSDLRLEVMTDHGRQSRGLEFHEEGGVLYWLDDGDYRTLMGRVSHHLGLTLTAPELDSLAEQHEDDHVRQRQTSLKRQKSDSKRLAVAIGRDQLLRRLPAMLVEHVASRKGGITDDVAGKLALSVFGVEALHEYRSELAASGLNPPTQWAGLTKARDYVRRMGFPEEFAGFEGARRDPTLLIHGRPDLPELHDFQQQVGQQLRELLEASQPKRALLALPTGAGKTRVAVETVVQHLADSTAAGPVVWIAQSDELCEQAVQTWAYVWRALGPDVPLTISRLWASNEAVAADGHQVVVATNQKLISLLERAPDRYSWLTENRLTIVDEAHFAIARSYTATLTWLGYGRSKKQDRAPLVGLTATPYRGTSEEETKRLVRRFGSTRLDGGIFGELDPYTALQDMGVLARVSHSLLEGADIEMTDEDLAVLERTNRLPRSVEARLGQDSERNDRILKLIQGLPPKWPVLLFAASVEHAQTMAALLTLDGIAAQAISADTSRGARQWAIEEFKAGKLQVLTNYGVLAQGFDAPAVRAVIVSRPTFSPTLYQQMIGRGLRGPRNGGKEECLVVNVRDTVARFGTRLAFFEFEHLWAAN